MDSPEPAARRLAELRRQVAGMILKYGHQYSEEPFKLTSGGSSHDYIDAKLAIAQGSRLKIVGEAFKELAAVGNVAFDAVGGLTMGADPVALAVAVASDSAWFTVRKQAKEHGRGRRIEGAELTADSAVFLVDDVITSGRSILEALDALDAAGAKVVLASTLVDRGDAARKSLEHRGVNYEPLLTYSDLNIAPVG